MIRNKRKKRNLSKSIRNHLSKWVCITAKWDWLMATLKSFFNHKLIINQLLHWGNRNRFTNRRIMSMETNFTLNSNQFNKIWRLARLFIHKYLIVITYLYLAINAFLRLPACAVSIKFYLNSWFINYLKLFLC